MHQYRRIDIAAQISLRDYGWTDFAARRGYLRLPTQHILLEKEGVEQKYHTDLPQKIVHRLLLSVPFYHKTYIPSGIVQGYVMPA